MKKNNGFFAVFTFLFAILCAGAAEAAGYGLNEISARGNAMQGALVGSTKDASAVYFNPANMPELGEGTVLMAGLTFARPDYDTKVAGITTDQAEHIFELPHLHFVTRLADDFWFGFGEYTEYGLGTHYVNINWPMAADSTKTTMYSFTMSPTVAWQATERLSLGAGPRLMDLNLISDRVVPAFGSHFHLDTDDWAVSYLASAAYQLTDTLRAGVVYRAQTDFHETGDIYLHPLGMGTGVQGDISMPQSVMIGLNWQVTDRLELGFAATWNDWSVNKSLDQDFESPALPDQKGPQMWHDTWRFSLGAEYLIDNHWAVQCGLTHDEDPTDAGVANTMCPPGDREQFGLGFSYTAGAWTFAADYMYVFIHDTDRVIHGVETSFRRLKTDTVGISCSYTF